MHIKGKFTLKSGEVLTVEFSQKYTPAVISLPEYSSPEEYGDVEDIEVTLDGAWLNHDALPTRYEKLVNSFIDEGKDKGWKVERDDSTPDYDFF